MVKIIVFINPDKKNILVCNGKNIDIYDFDDADIFLEDYKGKKCTYVTDVVETTIEEVVSLVEEIVGHDELQEADNKTHFIHSTREGTLLIPDTNIALRGPGECKIFDHEMYKLVQDSFAIRQLIRKGILEIITNAQMKKIVKSTRRENKKLFDRQQKSKERKDRELDAMLVDTGVKAVDAIDTIFDNDGENEADEINLDEDVKSTGTKESLEDLKKRLLSGSDAT